MTEEQIEKARRLAEKIIEQTNQVAELANRVITAADNVEAILGRSDITMPYHAARGISQHLVAIRSDCAEIEALAVTKPADAPE